MSYIEELIGRYLVLSQKSDSTLNIFFFIRELDKHYYLV